MADPTEQAATNENDQPAAEGRDADQENKEADTGFDEAFAERSSGGRSEEDEAADSAAKSSDDDDDNEAGQPPASQQAAAADPWDGKTPEELKAEITKLRHADASQRGRISSLTKKLNETAAAPKPSPAPAQSQDQDGNADDDQAAPAADELQKRMDQAIEDYPDVAGPFAEAMKSLRADMEKLGNQVSPIADAKDEATMTQAYIDLEAAHPDYRELAVDESYLNWIGDQPEGVQKLANSYDVKEVSLTLSAFKAERDAEMARLNPADEAKKNETDAKRARQLEGAKSVSQSNQPASSGTPNDFDAAFTRRAKKHNLD